MILDSERVVLDQAIRLATAQMMKRAHWLSLPDIRRSVPLRVYRSTVSLPLQLVEYQIWQANRWGYWGTEKGTER